MSATNTTAVPLVGVGGTAPYVFTVIASGTTIPATITGGTLTVDASLLEPGVYNVQIGITDQRSATSQQSVMVEVVDQAQFSILNRDVSYQPTAFPFVTSIPLASIGGLGLISWTLLSAVTTLPGVSISGATLSFSLASFGDWTVGIRATDSVGHSVTQVIQISVTYSQVVAVVDGHALIKVAANAAELGAHQFTIVVADSNAQTSKRSFSYQVKPAVSAVNISETAIDHFWSYGDTTTVVYPIAGDLVGFGLGTTGPLIAGNGISVTIDPVSNSLIATGPPTSFGNAELEVPIVILHGTTQVATIMKEFTLLSHDNVYMPTFTTVPTESWQQLNVGYMVAPTGLLSILLVTGAGSPTLYWDDIVVSPVTALANGGFETGLIAPWIVAGTGASAVSATSHTGGFGLALTPSAGTMTALQTIGNLTPGQVYNVSAWVKSSAPTTASALLQAYDPQTPVVTAGLGGMTCATRPYIVGETVGLDPLRPYFNSPTIIKNQGYTVRMALSSTLATLPLGLSLDSVTGLIYGVVLAADVKQSVLEYVDTSSVVQGTLTIVWDIVQSSFQLIDGLSDGQLQAPYSSSITTSSAALLATVSVYRGMLPTGLLFSLSGDFKSVVLSGAPTAAGYFDIWIEVTNANGQQAYLKKRLVVDYIPPLVILTDELQRLVSNAVFTQELNAFGGVQPYTWALVNGALPAGITLNPSSGTLAGTTAVTVYDQDLTLQVTDARGVAVTAVLPFVINNALTITTPTLPLILTGSLYHFQMQAEGGQGAYTWALATSSPALPGGITLSASGLLSGATSLSSYTANVILTVTDTAANTASQAFQLKIGLASQLYIDTEGMGPLVRGSSYKGILQVEGPSVAPYSWAVAVGTPNPLPAGLTLSGDLSTNGASATISGNTTATLLNYLVEVQVIDANGNIAFAFISLNTYSSLAITTASLPQATAGGIYSTQLACSGVNPSFTWTLDASSPALPAGLSITSPGLLHGTPAAASDVFLVFRVTDSLRDFTTKPLEFVAKVSTLAITSTTLAQYTAGLNGANTLLATGGAPAYAWSISPSSPNLLPTGLTLDAGAGTITGVTLAAGFSKPITFRVTDSIGVYRETTLTLSVITAIKLYAGPDWVNGTNFGVLGVIPVGGNTAGIAPRPNYSFLVVMTNLLSTSINQLGFGFPGSFGVNVLSLAGGTAVVQITDPPGSGFGSGAIGSNSFTFNVGDNGVSASAVFTWIVYPQANISLVTDSLQSLPTFAGQPYLPLWAGIPISNNGYVNTGLPTSTGWLDISNGRGAGFSFPALPSGVALTASDYAAATASSFTLSSDNAVANSLLSIVPNGNVGYRLQYNGGATPVDTTPTTVTVTNNEIAWWNPAIAAGDFFTNGSGGSTTTPLSIQWLVSINRDFMNLTSASSGGGAGYEGNGQAGETFTINLPTPLPPLQSKTIVVTVNLQGGLGTVNSIAQILNGNGFLTGWTVSFTTPKVTSYTTTNVSITASDTLTWLQNGSIVTEGVTYLNSEVIGWVGFNGPAIKQTQMSYSNNCSAPTCNSYIELTAGNNIYNGVHCSEFYQISSGPNNNPYSGQVTYSFIAANNILGPPWDLSNISSINAFMACQTFSGNYYGVAIGLKDWHGNIWCTKFQSVGIAGAIISSGPTPQDSTSSFDPTHVSAIVFFLEALSGAQGATWCIGTPSATFTINAESYS